MNAKLGSIIVIIIIIVGALIFFLRPENTANAPTTPPPAATSEENVEADTQTEIEASTDTDTEMDAGETTSTGGSDVGAEFPIIEEDDEKNDTETADVSTHVFDVAGVNFSFDVKEMRVKEGDTVTINFTSNDGFHDWAIDEFGAATDRVRTGETSSVTFVADKVGTYEYYCSVGSHRQLGMVGTLVVE